MLTSKQKQNLKALAHSLKAVIHIGKAGIEPKVITAVQKALYDHELIKVKLLESVTTPKKEAATTLAEKAEAEMVHIIGHTIILYKATEKEGFEHLKF